MATLAEEREQHGPDFYSVATMGRLDGKMGVMSKYTVFHEVEVPEGYGE